MKLPSLKDIDVKGKNVVVRMDLDLSIDGDSEESDLDKYRLESSRDTLEYLASQNAHVTIIGHRGRPKGLKDDCFSLEPVSKELSSMLRGSVGDEKMNELRMCMKENLRFNPGEEENDEEYAKKLSDSFDVYVNEAFATSHRKHASVYALPKLMKKKGKDVVFGFRFIEEVKNLGKVRNNPERPMIVVLGGKKKDKLDYLEPFERFADKILIGGRLPTHMDDVKVSIREVPDDAKLVVGELVQDKEDITIHTIERFENEISKAKTIVVSGPMSKFEFEGQRLGTARTIDAVAANESAFRVAGGGDTEKAISLFGLRDKFDWISVGGGSMLDFLADGTLPGIEAIVE